MEWLDMLKLVRVKNRKALRNKMAEVFSDQIKVLPTEMQDILLDDLVTAFENRLSLFYQVKSSVPLIEFELAAKREQVVV